VVVDPLLLLPLLGLGAAGRRRPAVHQLELWEGVLWAVASAQQAAGVVGEGGCEGGWAVWPTNRPVQ